MENNDFVKLLNKNVEDFSVISEEIHAYLDTHAEQDVVIPVGPETVQLRRRFFGKDGVHIGEKEITVPPGVIRPIVQADRAARRRTLSEESVNLYGAKVSDEDVEDLNGSLYSGSLEGEVLITSPETGVPFPPGMSAASDILDSQRYSVEDMHRFLIANMHVLDRYNATSQTPISAADIEKIALIRFFCARAGFISPKFDPAANYVEYNDAFYMTDAQMERAVAETPFRMTLTAQVRGNIRMRIYDLIATVAFVFRVRGHHWQESINELYTRVWNRTRLEPAPLPWNLIARHALHAIMPIHLDAIWKEGRDKAIVNGALGKRYTCAAAGTAAIWTIAAGYQDLRLVAPGIPSALPGSVQYLESLVSQLEKHRYANSINARYYGAPRIGIDESKLAAIAATIYAALSGFAPNAPLARAPSLLRVANNAPITGAIFARAISNIALSPKVVTALVELPAPND
jgi:hypothetical protein